MVRIVKAAENRVTAVLRGMERRRVVGFTQEKPYLVASYEPLVEIRKDPIEIDGLGMAVYDVAKQLIAISPDIPDETAQVLDQNKDPGRLGDIVAATVDLSPEERASLLVESDVAERLRRLLVLLQRKVELIKVKQKIDTQVREEFSKHQREAVLRQKLKAIQDELGEGEDASDLDAFDEKIKAVRDAGGRREDGAQAARAPQADGAVLGRVHRAAHLPRVAGRAAVVEAAPTIGWTSTRRARSSTPITTTSRR